MLIQVVHGRVDVTELCRMCKGRTGVAEPGCATCNGTGKKWASRRPYTYEAHDRLGLKIGDFVEVPPSRWNSHNAQIATVVALEGDPNYLGPVTKILTGYET